MKEEAYRAYVTDSIMILTENTAKYGGKTVSTRFVDVISPAKRDERTGDEIAKDVIERAGLVVRSN